MKPSILACLACLMVATPVSHGQTPPSAKRVVIGMPIYTADGAKIGEVTGWCSYISPSATAGRQ